MNDDKIIKDNAASGKPVENASAPVTSEAAAPVSEPAPTSEHEHEITADPPVKNDTPATEETSAPDKSFTDIFADDVPAADILNEPETVEVKRKPSGESKKELSQLLYFVRISGVLTAICVAIALLLSIVNGVTVNKIAENTAAEKSAAVMSIFTQADAVDKADGEYTSPVVAVYNVRKGGALIGQCVNVESSGFGGVIDMMVGVDVNGAVAGVKVISMSETPGLGSKTNSPDFLEQYNGSQGSFAVGDNIDAVAGATISSKSVTAGVNAAMAAVDADALAKAAAEVPTPEADEGEPPEDTSEAPTDEAPPEAPADETTPDTSTETAPDDTSDTAEATETGEAEETTTEETSE